MKVGRENNVTGMKIEQEKLARRARQEKINPVFGVH